MMGFWGEIKIVAGHLSSQNHSRVLLHQKKSLIVQLEACDEFVYIKF